MTYMAKTDTHTAIAPLQSAACTYRIALGRKGGQSTPDCMSWARLLTKPPGAVLHGELRPEGQKPERAFVNQHSIIYIEYCPIAVAP